MGRKAARKCRVVIPINWNSVHLLVLFTISRLICTRARSEVDDGRKFAVICHLCHLAPRTRYNTLLSLVIMSCFYSNFRFVLERNTPYKFLNFLRDLLINYSTKFQKSFTFPEEDRGKSSE
jgi:hypothetical protein